MRQNISLTFFWLALAAFSGLASAEDSTPSTELCEVYDRLEQAELELQELRRELGAQSAGHGAATTAGRWASWPELPDDQPAGAAPDIDFQRIAADPKPTVTPRGRIHADVAYFHQDAANRAAVGDIQDGAGFRRARLGVKGTVSEIIDYMVEVDFAFSGRPSFTDVYLGLSELPLLGNVRIGHYKEPFTLEDYGSDNFIVFLERGLPNAFSPARNFGLMARNHNQTQSMTWALGLFRTDADEFGDDVGDAGEQAVTGRVTFLPWYDECSLGRRLLHLGGCYSFRDADNDSVRFAQTPEIRVTAEGEGRVPYFVDSGVIPAENFQLFDLEAAVVLGSFSLQSEYVASHVNQIGGPDLFFHGFYVLGTCFLTGEHRNYLRETATFGATKPARPFTREGLGTLQGAWELTFRWSHVDLDDENIRGGRLTDLTLGLNWYLNSYTRVTFNYIHADLDRNGPSAENTFAMRTQIHF